MDGYSIMKQNGSMFVLKGPIEVLLEQYLCFFFKASKNQAKYEALSAGIKLAPKIGVTNL